MRFQKAARSQPRVPDSKADEAKTRRASARKVRAHRVYPSLSAASFRFKDPRSYELWATRLTKVPDRRPDNTDPQPPQVTASRRDGQTGLSPTRHHQPGSATAPRTLSSTSHQTCRQTIMEEARRAGWVTPYNETQPDLRRRPHLVVPGNQNRMAPAATRRHH